MSSSDLIAWNTQTGKEVWRINDGDVKFGDVSSDGKRLIVFAAKRPNSYASAPNTEDARILAVDTADGKPQKTHALKEESVYSLTVLPGSTKVACFDGKGIRVRDIDSGKVENEVKWGEDETMFPDVPPQFSADGKTLLRWGRFKISGGQTGLAGDGKSPGEFGVFIELSELSGGKVIGRQSYTKADEFPSNPVFSPDLKKMAAMIGAPTKIPTIVDISKLDSLPAR